MSSNIVSSSWEVIQSIFEESIPFNKSLDIKVSDLESGNPKLYVDMQEQFVGNFVRGNLHGGVIATLLDVIGGMIAFVDVVNRKNFKTCDEKIKQFSRMGTINIRIDYLRPGHGSQFTASGYVLRTGNNVAVTRMDLHNEENLLIAAGTGTYTVGLCS